MSEKEIIWSNIGTKECLSQKDAFDKFKKLSNINLSFNTDYVYDKVAIDCGTAIDSKTIRIQRCWIEKNEKMKI